MSSRNITKAISAVLTVLLLVFAYGYISKLLSEANFSNISINWLSITASAIAFCVYYLLLSVHWRMACQMIDPSDAPATEGQQLSFFASQPYKYLPTSLFSFSYRAVYAKKLGLGIAKSSAAQMIEYASMLAANFFLFAVMYMWSRDSKIAVLLLIVGSLSILGFTQVNKFKVRIKGKNLHINPRLMSAMVTLAIIAWFICGVSFVLLNQSLGFEIRFTEMVAANCIAFSLSILAVFAPGGIGVRELIYNTFSISSVAIIYWRILTFILDFVLGVSAIIKIRKNQGRATY